MVQPPKDMPGYGDLEKDEKAAADELYNRYAPIELEVRRVKRQERQSWEREFAHILANDELVKRGADMDNQGLHPDTIAALDDFNHKIAAAAILKVFGLVVGDVDVSEVDPAAAIELLSECGLIGYASKAARVAQAPSVFQGES